MSNNKVMWAKRAVLIGLTFSLVSCGMLSEDQQRSALEVVNQMVENQSLTSAQAEVMRQAISSGGREWWTDILNIVGGALLAWLGVRSRIPGIGRGAPTQFVGLASSKVIPRSSSAD